MIKLSICVYVAVELVVFARQARARYQFRRHAVGFDHIHSVFNQSIRPHDRDRCRDRTLTEHLNCEMSVEASERSNLHSCRFRNFLGHGEESRLR